MTSTNPSHAPTLQFLLYPAFATRGALSLAVERLRAWLLEKVIDAEVARGTPSPTLSPGVGVVLAGHSMGGIVAAEAVLGVAGECCADNYSSFSGEHDAAAAAAANATGSASDGGTGEAQGAAPMLFPRILGVLAFDTPYLGIAPGVLRYGAEERFREGKKWYDGAASLLGPTGATPASLFGRGTTTSANSSAAAASAGPAVASAAAEQTRSGGWTWGKAALVAGAGLGAGAAALAAGYAGREYITGGWTWATEHLAFVGCLTQDAELRRRVRRLEALARGAYLRDAALDGGKDARREKHVDVDGRADGDREWRVARVGFANLYTELDPGATKHSTLPAGATRTFCRLPGDVSRLQGTGVGDEDVGRSSFAPTFNEKATSEIEAHVSMFRPGENPRYQELVGASSEIVGRWVEGWLAGS